MRAIITILTWMYVIALTVGSLQETSSPYLTLWSWQDKVIHCLAYFIGTSLFFFSYERRFSGFFWVIFGICIEVIQYQLPWRSASLGDIFANCLGVFLADFLFHKLSLGRKFLENPIFRRLKL